MWVIEYWNEHDTESPVEEWLDELTKEQFKSVAKELKLLEQCGNQLRLPHSGSLGGGVFELRERRHGHRIYYTFSKHKIMVLLCAGDKHTQENDIKTARNRLEKLNI